MAAGSAAFARRGETAEARRDADEPAARTHAPFGAVRTNRSQPGI